MTGSGLQFCRNYNVVTKQLLHIIKKRLFIFLLLLWLQNHELSSFYAFEFMSVHKKRSEFHRTLGVFHTA